MRARIWAAIRTLVVDGRGVPEPVWTRLNERYRPAVALARLVLSGSGLEAVAGLADASAGRKNSLYWWRTPAGEAIPWARLRRDVLVRTGERLTLEATTTAVDAVDAVFSTFGVEGSAAGLLGED